MIYFGISQKKVKLVLSLSFRAIKKWKLLFPLLFEKSKFEICALAYASLARSFYAILQAYIKRDYKPQRKRTKSLRACTNSNVP